MGLDGLGMTLGGAWDGLKMGLQGARMGYHPRFPHSPHRHRPSPRLAHHLFLGGGWEAIMGSWHGGISKCPCYLRMEP